MHSGNHCTSTRFILSKEIIEKNLQNKSDQGVAFVTIGKYKTPLFHLLQWCDGSSELTAEKMLAWRQSVIAHGYSKISVQNYVTVINDFLRANGCGDLCIPKPLRNDLTGRTFGYLTAIAPTEKRLRRYVVWRCICKCGKEVELPSGMLLGGHTTSCGCLNMEILQNRNRYEEGTELRQALEEKILNPNSASGHVVVRAKRDKWVAYITYKGKVHNLGTYSKLEDAVKARARAKQAVIEDATRIYEETDHLYGDSPRCPPRPQKLITLVPGPVIIKARRSNNTSGYPGVTKGYGKWNASISVNKFRYKLGAYDELDDAITARKRAEELVKAGDIETLKAICTNWLSPPGEDENG